jgi:hypothetical protein
LLSRHRGHTFFRNFKSLSVATKSFRQMLLLFAFLSRILCSSNFDENLRPRQAHQPFDLLNPADPDHHVDEMKRRLREQRHRRNPNAPRRISHDHIADLDEMPDLCNKPHTVLNEYGSCDCEPGYISTAPDIEGCWVCNLTCGDYASCVSPGTCECDDAYFGDGFVCLPLIPKLMKTSPKACSPANCLLTAWYANTYHGGMEGFCRFNEKVVRAHWIADGQLTCAVPHMNPGKVFVSISFDARHFSDVVFPLKIPSPNWIGEYLTIAVLMALSMAGIGFTLTCKLPPKRVARFNDHERLISKLAAKRGLV